VAAKIDRERKRGDFHQVNEIILSFDSSPTCTEYPVWRTSAVMPEHHPRRGFRSKEQEEEVQVYNPAPVNS
jgi:hypothetical protein